MLAAFRNFAPIRIFMMVSAKNISLFLSIIIVCGACGKKEQELSPAEIAAKADSIVRAKAPKIRQQAREDLDKRLPIELKPKIDSIRNVGHSIGPVPVFPAEAADADTAVGLMPVPVTGTGDSLKQ